MQFLRYNPVDLGIPNLRFAFQSSLDIPRNRPFFQFLPFFVLFLPPGQSNFQFQKAYQHYLDGYDAWYAANNWDAMDAAWWDVGKAQRNVPAHVAQEYCRPDRSFYPKPEFNEATLPRVLTFYNLTTGRNDSWFPLTASNSGLGFNFALMRAGGPSGIAWARPGRLATLRRLDLAAIIRLDEVRTVDLTQSREHLNPPAMSQSMSV